MKRINREAIQRMVDARGGKAGGTSGGGGGSLAGYATQAWVNEGFVSIEFFNRLFTVYGPGETSSDPDVVIEPNDLDSTIKNIKAMFGFWTEQYLSALGLNPGGTGSATSLSMLDDVDITTPTNGQALVYNSTSQKWENQTISTVTALANLTDVLLTSPAANQVLVYDGTQWVNSSVKTVNGYSILGTGDIPASGGGTGNYLPLAGGTMTGVSPIYFTEDKIAMNFRPSDSRYNSKIEYMSSGNEALVFANARNMQSFIFVSGTDISNTSDWTTLSPAVQIKNKSLYVNTLLGNVMPDYNFQVSGTGYITTSLKVGTINIENGNEINHSSILCLNYNNSHIFACSGSGKMMIGGPWTTPSAKLHVNGASYLSLGCKFTSICIECDNSMGNNTARAGEINTYDSNLYIQHNSSKNLLLCNGGGNVGIGTSPSYKLHVEGTIYATGEITALSDIKQKNVEQYDAHLGFDDVANAPIIKFTWKDPKAEDKGLHVGSIAQYWEKVLPEAVKKDKEGTLSMSYGVVALVAAISTAKKVRELDERVTKLEKIER